jgi:hypothetical protein
MVEGNLVNELFEKWEERRGTKKFVRDGIINESAWREAKQHIVFLLKEINGAPQSFTGKAASEYRIDCSNPEYQRNFPLLCDKYPWAVVGQWAYGLLHLQSNPTFREADENRDDACRQVAIVNLKKTAGGNASNNAEIRRYALQDKEFLQEQIALLRPDMVVCCGKGFVFPLAKEIFPDAAEAHEIGRLRQDSISRGRVFRGREAIWIDFVHPSMRRGTREKKYCGLMELCRSLNSGTRPAA